ncbi:hypothetical protein [Microbacterium laevaniformans]|uniref:hypothetical protein n=1 Tax=Microbacterium laevaniformans TaxID=36807 RepID=UPI003D993262
MASPPPAPTPRPTSRAQALHDARLAEKLDAAIRPEMTHRQAEFARAQVQLEFWLGVDPRDDETLAEHRNAQTRRAYAELARVEAASRPTTQLTDC